MPTPQQPIGSDFGFDTTAATVLAGIDPAGTLAIVTGGYSSVGIESTREILVTHALRGGGRLHIWRSATRRGGDDVELAHVIEHEDFVQPLFDPLVEAWDAWPKAP